MLAIHVLQQVVLDDEDGNERFRFINNERRFLRNRSDPFNLEDTQFIKFYRLTKDMVQYLIQRLTPHMTDGRNEYSISPVHKIFVTIAFYATGIYQRPNGQNFLLPMSQPMVSRCMAEVTELICTHLADEWIVFPTELPDIEMKRTRFFQATTFPGTIGAVDCTHVAIIAPSREEHNYLNRKGFHSKNVQIISDYDLRILNINARYAGATHDSYIWRNSNVNVEMERRFNEGNRDTWCIGDSGYPQQPWLMTPITNALPDTPEGRYTKALVKARVCVERCIGVLKGRFRCIIKERVLHYDPRAAGNIAVACAVLHNICTDGRVPVYPHPVLELPELQQHDHVRVDGPVVQLTGRLARSRVIEMYFA